MTTNRTILFGLTTKQGANWREKVAELSELKITELALFLGGLKASERSDFFKALEASPVTSIPCVHLSDDFTPAEADYCISKYKTKFFTCHADAAGYAVLDKLPKHHSLIYLENPEDPKLLSNFSLATLSTHQVTGLCIDLSHAASTEKTNKTKYKELLAMAGKLPITVNHISGVRSHTIWKFIQRAKSHHEIVSLTEFDYLKSLPKEFFGKYLCIELDNTFLEQYEVKQYLELIIE